MSYRIFDEIKSFIASQNPHCMTFHGHIDAVALLFHVTMLLNEFNLFHMETTNDIIEKASKDECLISPKLPDNWNTQSTISFEYTHKKLESNYLLCISTVFQSICIYGKLKNDDTMCHIIVPLHKIIKDDIVFPISDRRILFDPQCNMFLNVDEWMTSFKKNMIDPFLLNTKKDPITSTEEDSLKYNDPYLHSSSKLGTTMSKSDFNGPSVNPLRSMNEIKEKRFDPLSIGASDLNILSPYSEHGGMYMGPTPPRIHRPDVSIFPPTGNPFSPEFLPPGAVPPGSRFDPILTVDPNFFLSGTGKSGLSVPKLHSSGEPGNDELLPPGSSSFSFSPGYPGNNQDFGRSFRGSGGPSSFL